MSSVTTVSNSSSGLVTLLAQLQAKLQSTTLNGGFLSGSSSDFSTKLVKEIAELGSEITSSENNGTSTGSSTTAASNDTSNSSQLTAAEMAKALKLIEEMQSVLVLQGLNTVNESLLQATSQVSATSSVEDSSVDTLR
jgi:NDP-sugar pyrophosphorylase family protein